MLQRHVSTTVERETKRANDTTQRRVMAKQSENYNIHARELYNGWNERWKETKD